MAKPHVSRRQSTVWSLGSKTSLSSPVSPAVLLKGQPCLGGADSSWGPLVNFLGSTDLVSCWVFIRVLVRMWERVNCVQLLLFFTAWKPKSTSWHVAESRESHTFSELCSTNKLASLGCREPGTRWAPRCFLLIFMSSSSIHQSVSCRGKTRWTDGRQSGGFSL